MARPDRCPICTGTEPRVSARFRRSRWPTWECRDCDTAFVWPLPQRAELAAAYAYEAYGESNYSATAAQSVASRRLFDALLQRVELSSPARGSLLDLGSSVGHMLEAAAQRGWSVSGIELDPATASLVRERTGFDVRAGVAEEVLSSFGAVDLIVMSHWLEHLPDPSTAFARATEHLPVGGGLLLRVPNARSQGAGLLGSFWPWYCPPFHLFYFSRRSIEYLAKSNGLSIEWLETARGDAQPLPIEILNAAYRWWGRNEGSVAVTSAPEGVEFQPDHARVAMKKLVIRLRPWGERLFPFEMTENTELRALLRRRASAPTMDGGSGGPGRGQSG